MNKPDPCKQLPKEPLPHIGKDLVQRRFDPLPLLMLVFFDLPLDARDFACFARKSSVSLWTSFSFSLMASFSSVQTF
jgi:hypothetical protein